MQAVGQPAMSALDPVGSTLVASRVFGERRAQITQDSLLAIVAATFTRASITEATTESHNDNSKSY